MILKKIVGFLYKPIAIYTVKTPVTGKSHDSIDKNVYNML